ncbi:MAG: GtrA family protein [Mucilaginibacter sp.]|uniref:GtrA family protein n=1 Tax=Mucilaginibacter sp. TaxID=1882438 RepID=UPI003264380B
MTDKQPSFWKALIKNQVIRFVLSAGVGFAVDVAAYYILYDHLFDGKGYTVLGLYMSRYVLSLAISFFLGVLVNFLITRFLVFSESTLSPKKQFFRFISVAILGFFANLGILAVLVKHFNMDPPIARPTAALSLFFASFFVHKLFSFNLSLRNHATRNHSK